MQKMILVKTPLTTDGNSPVIGPDGRQVYTESILTEAARKTLEKRNLGLNAHLKVIIEDYNGPVGAESVNEVVLPQVPPTPAQPTKKTVQNVTA